MPKIIAILMCVFSLIPMGCSGEKRMNIDNPSYYIRLNMQRCFRIVAVNGFELERDYKARSSAAEIPINHLIKNGSNYFELMVPSQENVERIWNENSVCAVEVRVKGTVDDEYVDFKVADIDFNADYSDEDQSLYKNSMPAGSYKFEDEDTVLLGGASDSVIGEIEIVPNYIEDMETVFRRPFVANVPFPKWAFFEGDVLFDGYHPISGPEEYREAKKIVWPKVQELWDLFETKDIDKILSLFEFRSQEYDQAFYREPGNTLEQLRNSIENVYADDLPLNRKENKKMQLVVTYANNMVTIVNAATYNGTVMFYDMESDSNTFYTVYWMKKDGEWIIAR